MTFEPTDRILTIPNLVTLLRLLLVPLFFVLLVFWDNSIAAFFVFAIAASTDFLDGKLARATGSVSKLGQQFDPLVDRILIIAGVIAVFIVGRVPLWLLLILVSRDAIMLAVVAYLRARHDRQFEVIFLGKLTTAVVMVGFCLQILNWPIISISDTTELGLGLLLLYLGAILSLTSGGIYVWRALSISNDAGMQESGSDRGKPAVGMGDTMMSGRSYRSTLSGSSTNFGTFAMSGTTSRRTRRASYDSRTSRNSADSYLGHIETGNDANDNGGSELGINSNFRAASSQSSRASARRSEIAMRSSRFVRDTQLPTANTYSSPSTSPIGKISRAAKTARADRAARTNRAPRNNREASGTRKGGIGTILTSRTGSANAISGRSTIAGMAGANSVNVIGESNGISDTVFKRLPKKLLLSGILLAIIVVLGAIWLCVDAVQNWDVIHKGVSVSGVDLSGMTREQAAEKLTETLATYASSEPVIIYANEQAKQTGTNELTFDFGHSVQSYENDAPSQASGSWRVDSSSIGLSFNANAMAERAYEVGRGSDFILGRLASNLFGVKLTAEFDFSKSRLSDLEGMVTEAVGTKMVNSNIAYEQAQDVFVAVSGSDGYEVNHQEFMRMLTEAFTSTTRELVAPMAAKPQEISMSDAKKVAELTQELTDKPVSINYDEKNYDIPTETLRSWVSASVEYSDKASLITHFNASSIEDSIDTVIGDIQPGVPAVDAKFVEDEGVLKIQESEDGIGIDYTLLADELAQIVFANASSPASLPMGSIQPNLTTAQAKSYKLTDKIAEFTTYYWTSKENRIINVHLAADYINGSLIEPDGIWSFNERVGECTAERGFKADLAIINDEYQDEIGGGVCQVASTVFNSAYEAGMPIEERINHSLYLSSYPDGRDSAIAWPYADLKFRNDTSNWMLITMSYTNTSVTATLWGVSPGYIVYTEASEWVKGKEFEVIERDNPDLEPGEEYVKVDGIDGKSITVTRTVYDADGNIVRKDTFSSKYAPTNKIVEKGPKKVEEEKESNAAETTTQATTSESDNTSTGVDPPAAEANTAEQQTQQPVNTAPSTSEPSVVAQSTS
jgi:CDP-diacylglycerol--glycerol-3-phosphate 3-phosphatidyltransferase